MTVLAELALPILRHTCDSFSSDMRRGDFFFVDAALLQCGEGIALAGASHAMDLGGG